jgi:hypothetical protein
MTVPIVVRQPGGNEGLVRHFIAASGSFVPFHLHQWKLVL